MANKKPQLHPENLKPIRKNDQNAKEIQRKGGICSGIAKRRRKSILELIETAMDTEIVTKENGLITAEQAYALNLVKRCVRTGDIKLAELIAKLRGEFIDKKELTGKDGTPLAPIIVNIPTEITDEKNDGKRPDQIY